jgi:hypothetical protein
MNKRRKRLLVWGVAILVLGIIALAWKSNTHSACSSDLGAYTQALTHTQRGICSAANVIFYLGIVMLFGGAGLVVGSFLVGRGEGSSDGGVAVANTYPPAPAAPQVGSMAVSASSQGAPGSQAPMAIHCPACQQPQSNTSRFCGRCGTPLADNRGM